MNSVSLIGVAGCSASGKTTFSNYLRSALGEEQSGIITVDSYYNAQDNLTIEQRRKTNYDHPDSLELSLLFSHLETLLSGSSVQVPIYDYSQHNRSKETQNFNPKKYIILEGILSLHLENIRNLLSTSIFVEAPLGLMYERRLERDVRERGRTAETVEWQWEKTVMPMYDEFCLPTKAFAQHVFDGSGFSREDVSEFARINIRS